MAKNRRKKKKGCGIHNWVFVEEITIGTRKFVKSSCTICGKIKNKQKKEGVVRL